MLMKCTKQWNCTEETVLPISSTTYILHYSCIFEFRPRRVFNLLEVAVPLARSETENLVTEIPRTESHWCGMCWVNLTWYHQEEHNKARR